MRRFLFIAMALFAGGGLSVHAQTATDLNEGVRVTADAATGAQVLTWWRKAGRTYFVQQSYDLITWTYVPVVRSGTVGVVDGLNFSSTDVRQFWRLKYTDASLGGLAASAADFDHDGLTNQQELNLGTDPFNVDTDEDGWNDSLEKTVGSNGANAASTPPGVNSNFINLIRSYNVQTLEASENYWMDWFSTGRPPGQAWSLIHHWYLPGDVSYSTSQSTDKPTVTYYGFPFTALLIDSAWQSAGSLSFQAYPLPDYASHEEDFFPTASMSTVDAYSSATYKNESAGWHCRWYRYRLHLSETLPYDYSESYLAITHEYGPNPDYGQGGDHTNERWIHTGIRSVTPMILTIPAGARTGAWKFQSPTADGPGNYVAVQMVPIPITLRANPNNLAPPAPGTMFTPAPENAAHYNIVNNIGMDRLGKLPMGMGRAGEPGGAGNIYAAPVEVYASVPDIPSISWKWKRSVKTAYWKVQLFQPVPGGLLVPGITTLGAEIVANDDPQLVSSSVIRSSNGRIYTSDSSGVKLSSVAGSLALGDFYYEERQFDYWLEGTFNGSVFETSRTKVAQIITMQRCSVTGTLANDFWGGKNYNFIGEVDLEFTDKEVIDVCKSPYPAP